MRAIVLLASVAASGCTADENANTSQPDFRNAVVAESIDFNDPDCTAKGLPISLVLKNEGNRPTKAMIWSFVVTRPNHSANLALDDRLTNFGDPNRQSDRILEPGQAFKVCSSAPTVSGYETGSPELEYAVVVEAQ